MLLAVETSSAEFGLALADGMHVVAERTRRRDAGHPGIGGAAALLMSEAGVGVGDLDRLAVDVGPGNLGSVRSGVAYVNGLAFALGRGVAALDTLDLLARASLRRGDAVLCLRTAGGGAVYAGLFLPDGTVARRVGLLSDVVPALAAGLPHLVVAGVRQDETVAALPGVAVVASGVEVPAVGELVRAALALDTAGDEDAVSPLTEISPVYG